MPGSESLGESVCIMLVMMLANVVDDSVGDGVCGVLVLMSV